SDQRFEVAPHFGLRSKRGQPRQVRRSPLVQVVKASGLFQTERQSRIVFHPVKHSFQLRPVGAFAGDEPLKINNHKSCLCFTLKYCEINSALNRSFSTSEKRTPQ